MVHNASDLLNNFIDQILVYKEADSFIHVDEKERI